jgi:hypothetical protein
MSNDRYNMSFTTGGLFHQESVEVAKLFLSLHDWKAVRKKALDSNLVRSRTKSSSVRVCREICKRLELLNVEELKILIEGSVQEQKQILWLSVCRRYRFIYDFAVEIIREKYLNLSAGIFPEDYDAFFNSKVTRHNELEDLTDKTRAKLRQVLFRILKETELLGKDNTINPSILTPRIVKIISQQELSDLTIFPASEAEIRDLLQ